MHSRSKVALTPHQRSEYAAVQDAYERAHVASMDGKTDLEAINRLSPGSFDGKSDDEQRATAEQLRSSLGILRDTALDRAINHAPVEQNAKIQDVLKKAARYKETNKPGLVFSHSRESVAAIAKALQEAGHNVITLTGSDTAKSKGEKVAKFQKGDGDGDVFVMSDAVG